MLKSKILLKSNVLKSKNYCTKEIIEQDLMRSLNENSTLVGMPGRPVDINKLRQHVVNSRFLATSTPLSTQALHKQAFR